MVGVVGVWRWFGFGPCGVDEIHCCLLSSYELFERSEFLIDTSQKKSLRVCTRARVHACSTSLGFSVRSANRIWPKHGIPLPV